jgi:hypothetical protein
MTCTFRESGRRSAPSSLCSLLIGLWFRGHLVCLNCRLWKVCYLFVCVITFLLTLPNEENSRSRTSSTGLAQKERYGPTFAYDEFLVTRSRTSSFLITISFALGLMMITYIAPVRLFRGSLFSLLIECIVPLDTEEVHSTTWKQAF